VRTMMPEVSSTRRVLTMKCRSSHSPAGHDLDPLVGQEVLLDVLPGPVGQRAEVQTGVRRGHSDYTSEPTNAASEEAASPSA
jgi:hypothetical protein